MPYFIATLASVSPKWNMCVVYPSLCSKDTRLVLSTSGADLDSTAGSRDSMPHFLWVWHSAARKEGRGIPQVFLNKNGGGHSIWRIKSPPTHYSRYWEVVLLSVCDVSGDQKWPMGSFFWLIVSWYQSNKKSKIKQLMKIKQQWPEIRPESFGSNSLIINLKNVITFNFKFCSGQTYT